MTICKICNNDYVTIRKLSYHIKSEHHLTPEIYYRQYCMIEGEDLCENCGKPLKFIKLTKPFGKTCSRECFGKNRLTKERRNKTNLEKFGAENPFAAEEIKEKIQHKIIEKYGGMGLQSTIIKNKAIQTNLEKFGADNPWKAKQIIEDLKQNRLDKIEQFEKENNCTERQKLIDKFGASWLSIENELDCIWLDNNHKFIKNYEISKLEELGPKYCRHALNNLEIEIFEFIRSIYPNTIRQNDRKILEGKELDIYIPKLKLGIEIDGDYWHSNIFKNKDFHYNKSNLCQSLGIRLIHIQEYMWHNNKNLYKDYLIKIFKNRNYFEIESQIDDYIILNYDFGLPQSIDNYDIYEFSGPTKLDISNYNVYGCGNTIYKKNN